MAYDRNQKKGGQQGYQQKKTDAAIPRKTITNIDEINAVSAEMTAHSKWSGSNNNMYVIIGTSLSLEEVVGIDNTLEIPLGKSGSKTKEPKENDNTQKITSTKFVDYASKAQLLLKTELDADHHIRVVGVELAENSVRPTTGFVPSQIGTTKIVGEQIIRDTIVINPIQIMQGYGVNNNNYSVENGVYNFRGVPGVSNLDEKLSKDICCKTSAQRGLIVDVTPLEISFLMENNTEIATIMRENKMGFATSEIGKQAINQYIEKDIEIYHQVKTQKFEYDTVSLNSDNLEASRIRKSEFDKVLTSPDYTIQAGNNLNQLHLSYAGFQVKEISKALEERRFLTPEKIAQAEEQLHYYNSYRLFAAKRLSWNEQLIQPIKDLPLDIMSQDKKDGYISYLSVQNGFSPRHFEQMSQAYASVVRDFKTSLAAGSSGPESIGSERIHMYSQQISYLGELIRIHPENPINKPYIPTDSTLNADTQRIDSSIYVKMKEYNNKVVEEPEKMLSLNILSSREKCEQFLKKSEDTEAKNIVKQAIENNQYRIDDKTFLEFSKRENRRLILNGIESTFSNNPIGNHEDLVKAALAGDKELKEYVIKTYGVSYSGYDLDGFLKSSEFRDVIKNPEILKHDAEKMSHSNPFDREAFKLEILKDPIECQKCKQELLLVLEEANTNKMVTNSIIEDIRLLDNHIIANRMRLTENQRIVNNHDFDNVYSLHPSKEVIKELMTEEMYRNINPEKFQNPAFVSTLLSQRISKIEKEVEANPPQINSTESSSDIAPSKESESESLKNINKAIQEKIDETIAADKYCVLLKDMLTVKNEELKYSKEDFPQHVIDKISLRNEIIQYGRDNKDNRLENIEDKFGTHPLYTSVISESQLANAIKNRDYYSVDIKPTSVNEILEKLEKYNEVVETYNTTSGLFKKHSLKETFADNPTAMEILNDKDVVSTLKPIEITLNRKEIDTSSPIDCYIKAKELMSSDNIYAQKMGQEMMEVCGQMENDLKIRTIYENCKITMESKDLSSGEIDALRTEAQRQSIVCLAKKLESGSMNPNDFNSTIEHNIQNISSYSVGADVKQDESKLGELFSQESLLKNRETFITKQSEEALTHLQSLETNLKELYALNHGIEIRKNDGELTIGVNETKNEIEDKYVSEINTADIAARIQAIQSVKSEDAESTALNELNRIMHENRFYVEHVAPLAQREEDINALKAKIDIINNPDDRLSTEAMKEWLSLQDAGKTFERGYIKSLCNDYTTEITRRESATACLESAIKELRDSSPIRYNLDENSLASNLSEYKEHVLLPKIKELSATIDSYSLNGSPYTDITPQEFIEKRVSMINPSQENIETVRRESYAEFLKISDTIGFESEKSELVKLKSELEALDKCQLILNIKSDIESYREATKGLSITEQIQITDSLGKVEENVTRMDISSALYDRHNSDSVKWAREHFKDISRLEDFLSSGVSLSDKETEDAKKTIANILQYNKESLVHSEISEASIGDLLDKGKDDQLDIKKDINKEALKSFLSDEIKLTPAIENFYNEHQKEIDNLVKPIDGAELKAEVEKEAGGEGQHPDVQQEMFQ